MGRAPDELNVVPLLGASAFECSANELGARESPKPRETRDVSPNHPLPARLQAHGGELPGERTVGLYDARKLDTFSLQPIRLDAEMRLVASRKNDDKHAVRVRLDERLTDGVT